MTEIKWWMTRKIEAVQVWIAWKLPKSILKWALVRCAVKYAGNDKHPGEATYEQMYKAI